MSGLKFRVCDVASGVRGLDFVWGLKSGVWNLRLGVWNLRSGTWVWFWWVWVL